MLLKQLVWNSLYSFSCFLLSLEIRVVLENADSIVLLVLAAHSRLDNHVLSSLLHLSKHVYFSQFDRWTELVDKTTKHASTLDHVCPQFVAKSPVNIS